MAIRRLEVADLRNLASVSFDLDPQFNYFHGPNGSGKTALLEAIHLLARGRSFRGRQVSALIGHGADMLVVRAVLQAGRPVVVSKTRAGSTELRIDGEVCGRLSDAASMLPIQLILPTVGDLVFGSPGERRGFLDWGVFHVNLVVGSDLCNLTAVLDLFRQVDECHYNCNGSDDFPYGTPILNTHDVTPRFGMTGLRSFAKPI